MNLNTAHRRMWPARVQRLLQSRIARVLLGGCVVSQAALAQSEWNGSVDTDWTNGSNWSAGVPLAGTDALFVRPIPGTGSALSLGTGSLANSLWIQDNYTFNANDLTLTSGAIRVNLGHDFTLNSQLSGASGLTLSGGGVLRLTNTSNDYTGDTSILGGMVVITDPDQLGASSSVIHVTAGNSVPSNTTTIGITGGGLMLDGTGGTINLTRDLNLEGTGHFGSRSGALVSVGNNELSGVVNTAFSTQTPATFRQTRLLQSNGILTLSGTLNAGSATSGAQVITFGGVNTAGAGGSYQLTGVLSGLGYIEKSGAGVLSWNPSDTSGFGGRLRISGSATGNQSSVLVTGATDGLNTTNIFGTANGANAAAPIDLNGGVLEIRNDNSLSFGRNVYHRASSRLFAGPAPAGLGVNNTMSFEAYRLASNTTHTFDSRNGYGVTFNGSWTQENSNNNATITNSMGGTLTFTGNAWNNSDSNNRSLNIGGNGNTIITGSLNTSGAGVKTLTKTGSGKLEIRGTATTLNGPVNINGGTLAITDFRSINNNAETINIGTGSTAGALVIGTSSSPTLAGLTTNKAINFAGSTGGASIYANQSGSNPVTLNGAITIPTNGNKTITLGGSNQADNVLNSGIPNSPANTTTVQKLGEGTWVLAGQNTFAGTLNIANGTLKLQANNPVSSVLPTNKNVTFNATNTFAGGTLEFVGQTGVNNLQTIGTLNTTQGENTLRMTPGAGGTASMTLTALTTGAGGTLNVVGADFSNNQVTLNGANGLVNRTTYWAGADFAYREDNVLRAPVYGSDAGFETSASALTVGANNQITGSFTTGAAVSITTLKINGSQTLTVDGGTLTLASGGLLATGGNGVITGPSTLALGTQALVARVNLPTDTLTVSTGDLTGSGGLTKSGQGTLNLEAPSTATGTISINQGTIKVGNATALGAANRALTIRQNAVLDLNGISLTNTFGATSNNGVITNTAAGAVTLLTGGTGGNTTSFGLIHEVNGRIHVVKSGSGNASWLGVSNYTGSTTISNTSAEITQGLVTVDTMANIGQPSGIGAGDATSDASNAGSLVFEGTFSGLVYAGNLRDNNLIYGSQSATTDRLFTLNGETAVISSTVSNSNGIVWSNSGAIVHGSAAARNLTLRGGSVGDNTFNPQLTDSGALIDGHVTSLTKLDGGQWNLGNANNTYSGVTSVQNGVLALNQAGALPSSSPLVLMPTSATSEAVLQMNGVFERSLASTATAGTGSLTWGYSLDNSPADGGAGFAAHTAPLTVAIGGIATPTPLTWGADGFVGTGGAQNLVLNSTSALSFVDFKNSINLGNAVRTVNVLDNLNTGADYAILSGDLSGVGGGLLKAGAGPLILSGANTYTGNTDVRAGTLQVYSLSGSTGPASSSVGAGGVAMNDANAILLGNGGTGGAILQYTGPGETSDRKIRLNTTTGSNQIHADGTGRLVLTNVANDLTAGNKTLLLRGSSVHTNLLDSVLTDNGATTLSVTVDGSTAWVLTQANTYSGTTTTSAGLLGLGHDDALGTGTLVNSNGNVFAYGGDRTISNNLTLGGTTTTTTNGWQGDYNLTFTGNANATLTTSTLITSNSLSQGKALTLPGISFDAITANRVWSFSGPGHTVIDGDVTTTSSFGISLRVDNGILSLGGTGTSTFNQNNAVVEVDHGTLRFIADNVVPSTAGAGGLTLSPEALTSDVARVEMNGTSQTFNALNATTDGTVIVDNNSSNPATLRFGANASSSSFGAGIGSYSILNTGSGPLSLVKTSTGTADFITGLTLSHAGATISEGGGAFNINSPLTATTSLGVTDGSTLALQGGLTNPGLVTSITVDNGSTLSLLDGAGSAFSGLNTLTLGSALGSMTTLSLNVGDLSSPGDFLNTDLFSVLNTGAVNLFAGNQITFNLTDIGLNPNLQYDLLTFAPGGLTSGPLAGTDWILGNVIGGFTFANLVATDTRIYLDVGALITGDLYWRGQTDNTWNGALDNWSTDKAGTLPGSTIPGAGTNVIFAHDGASGAVVTTLEQNFKVNSLTFEAGVSTPTSVTVDPGALPDARIEVAPQTATDGIEVSAGGPSTVNINTGVRLGADQTWTVTDTSGILRLGSLQGEADVTKAGDGKVTLTQPAEATFNSGATSDVTVSSGTLEILDPGALGTLSNNNVATVTASGTGAFFINHATASTTPNPITLNGGTLSAGGNTQTYSGTVAVTADSSINMADSNGPGSSTARSITLSGALTGSGGLTVSSNTTTLVGGNAESGTLTINHAAGTWNGDLILTSGTVTITAAASPTVTPGNITFDGLGRHIIQGVNGQTINRAGTLTFTAGGIGEYFVDNTSSPLASDFVVNQNGQMNLGSGGTGAAARFTLADAASQLNITGNVLLGGNSSISVDGGDADSIVTISGPISDGGNGYSLAINDDEGGWGVTNDIIRLSGVSTFTGNVTLASGTLEFTTVTNASAGPSSLGNGTVITSTGNSILRFSGTTAQATDRPITATAGTLTLSANGDEEADSITYNGAITTGGNSLVLSGAADRQGFITAGITQTGDAADLTVNGGTWTHTTGTSRIGDDVTLTGADSVLNLDSGLFQVRDDFTVTAGATLNLNNAGALSFNVATLSADASLRATNGGTIALGANDAVVPTQFDGLRLGVDAAGVGTLNMGAFNQTVTEFLLGNRNLDREGIVNGTGTLTVTGNLDLYEGVIHANLASSGSTPLEKLGLETVTLSGDNSGLASTGSTLIDEGTLVLDYTTSNTTKIRAASVLDMRGSNLVLYGHASAATSQAVANFTMGSGGNNVITLLPGAGQDILLSLGAITRAINSQDGTLRLNLPSGAQTATNGVTTTTGLTNGLVGTAGYLTVNDGTGTWFATKSGNNIVALVSTAANDVSTWATGAHVTDETTGFTGTASNAAINSLRFDAAGGSTVNLGSTGVLGVTTGGILVTGNVVGSASIQGGTLFSGALASNVPELIVTQDSSSTLVLNADIRTNTALIKSGPGTLLLNGNNVSTGVTDLQNGTLQLAGGNAVGDTSLVTLSTNRDTTLELQASETIGRLQGGMRAEGADIGTVSVGSHALTIQQAGGNTTYDGRFSGSGTITKTGNSVLTLRGNDAAGSFTGAFQIQQGLVVLSGTGTPFQGASNLALTGPTSSLRFDNDQTTAVASRINDNATITLNSTAGTTADALGFYMRRTGGSTTGTETVGQLVLNSGHNTVAAAGTGTDRIARILFSNATPLARHNLATLLVIGQNLNATAGQRGRISFSADPGGAIGGGGLAGTPTLSLFPYMVGEDTGGSAPSGASHFGNSFMRFDGTDMRALDLTTEYTVGETAYNALGGGLLAHNVRFTATPGAVLDADTTGFNSLVLDSATGITLTGPAQGLQLTSGALLAASAGAHVIDGFTTLTTGAGNPYYLYVTNPAGSLTLNTTTLSSAEPLVKSGAGTLVLGAINSVTGVYLNQGTLEIGDLDHLGGNSGDLVFAGGTLRLGAGFADDLSARTITFQPGGGTLDTNGNDALLANSLGSGLGGFTKTGTGNLTLNGSATYTGDSVLAAGTITIGASNALGNGGNLSLAAGTTLALGTNSLTHGLVTTSGASPQITGTGTLTASNGFAFAHTGNTQIDAVLAGSGGLFKNQTNTVTLTGLNTYTGTTEIQNGTLSFNSLGNVGGGASALGNPGTAEDGVIRMGLTTASTTLTYTGSGHSSDRLIGMQGTTGGVTLNGNGTGGISYGGARFENAGNKTLTLGGTSAAHVINSIGDLRENGGVLSLVKNDANTWNLAGTNTYTGPTSINAGTLLINGDHSGATGALTIAPGATLGGSGLLGGAVTIQGAHSPGNSAGVQTFNAGLTYDGANTSLVWELFSNVSDLSPNPPDGLRGESLGWDGVDITGGDLNFISPTTMSLVFNAGSSPSSQVLWSDALWTSNQQWLVYQVTGGGSILNFSNFSIFTTDWLDSNGDALSTYGGDASSFFLSQAGGDIYLNFNAIPEPSRALFVLLGGLGLLLRRRRLD